ncbi:TetR/AcrR family transcriptional regulator [Actinomadura madurae]|uniref:TetR/AcrR family transcriptional regulator n=1 Tax=Actinomadura madurae TaxID=1993 RepID=UPI002026CFC4|nr:TetR/AcrR family transcriptional regulator [Actinomadura madurae]MCP9952890.1 TetR family transcriptional regulator [Actinomadura madurae]MCP9969653.1 TetR family transcriptional regulator [Actinomadura madurae]MCP9982109.1 TetR family transcriptional regulator [Actinomadura madurae]MCQ0006365.1 TetR family transcriptional regulator [Actinomadura madurae]MCQ0018351.1 TetR family transcriptional regulator [Actinomadura madurae]
MQVEHSTVERRPKRDREATRRRILDAARDLFGEHGYDGVTVRMIAARAEANMALVHRYFGSKAALFGEVLAGESVIRGVIAGDPAGLPRRLAEHFVRQLERGSVTPMSRILDRSAGQPEVTEILLQYLEDVIVQPMVAQLDGPDARARALLASTIIMGGGPVRRLLGLGDLRAADPADLTDRLTAMFTAALAPPAVTRV